jgi:hypothetical protein
MKHIIVLALVLFSTAAKAEWTPGTVLLGKFQQELYSAHDPQQMGPTGIYAQLKSHLSALIGWSKHTENKVLR